MNPGVYNHRLTILQDINRDNNITDDNGSPIENWQKFTKIWCRKEGMNAKTAARIIYAAGANQSKITGIYISRYREDITPDMRATDSLGTYIIVDAFDKDGSRSQMTILTQVVTNSGS